MRRLRLAGLACGLALAPVAADAAVFKLNYTTFADSLFPAVSVAATLTTDDGSFYGTPGYLVTGITGTRGGVAIDGLADPFSEVFFPGDIVDSFGVTFTAGGFAYNLVRNNPSFYNEFATPVGDPNGPSEGRLVLNGAISLTPAAVPEPASWALMIVGFVLVGSARRYAASSQPPPSAL